MKPLIALMMLLPLQAWAAGPFDGTWKLDPSSVKSEGTPIEQTMANGRFKCVGCDPNVTIDVKADGTDQKVTGTNDFDTAAIQVVDAHTMKATYKKKGEVALEIEASLSADGKTTTGKWTAHPLKGPAVTGTNVFTRVGAAPAGAHALSGLWRFQSVASDSTAALTVTFHGTADGIKMTAGTGETYTAKFGGPDVAVKNDRAGSMVSVKKLDANSFEETWKHEGKPVQINRMSVAGDTMTSTPMRCSRSRRAR